ncbi:MAG: hypothetical protein R3F47_12195 [Gammaproteobacteria bacterium]
MQQEGQRLAYLQALGITQYVPLRPIDGAPTLPVMAWEAEVVAADESATVVEPVEAPVSAVVAEVVEKITTSVDAKTATAPMPDAQAPSTGSAPSDNDIPQLDLSRVKLDDAPKKTLAAKPSALQRFTLAVITLPQRARLLVQLSQPDAPGLSAVEYRMLGDLLLALGSQQDINDSSIKLFRWPLVNNPRIAADASAARDGLLAFLAAAQGEQPIAKTVVLGTAALSCFPHQQIGQAFTLPELDSAAGAGHCLMTHSLLDLQRDWSLKPALWQHLHAFL